MKKLIAIFLAAAMLALSSCTLFRFETYEEHSIKESERQSQLEEAEAIDPKEMLSSPYSYRTRAANDSGITVALYAVELPKFLETGARAGAFEKINEFYEAEFGAIKEAYDYLAADFAYSNPTLWASIEPPDNPYKKEISYELLPSGHDYISIMRTVKSTSDTGAETLDYSLDLFLATSGWKLAFSDLFGTNLTKAEKLVVEKFRLWCSANGFEEKNMAAAELTESFLLTETELVLRLPPRALAYDNPSATLVRLSLSDFALLFK